MLSVDLLPNPDSDEYTPMELAVIGNELRLIGKELVSLAKEEAIPLLNSNGLLYDKSAVFRSLPSGEIELEFPQESVTGSRHKKAAVAQETRNPIIIEVDDDDVISDADFDNKVADAIKRLGRKGNSQYLTENLND